MVLEFVEYALLLFLPGLAALVTFRQIESCDLLSLLARSYGLSLAIDALVIFVATFTGIPFEPLPSLVMLVSVGLILGFGVFHYNSREPFARLLSLSKGQLLALLMGVIFAVLILSQFVKYPMFPKTYSVDFLQHYRIIQGILAHQLGGAQGLLYYGVHYVLGMGYLLVGGEVFIQIQYLMAILVAPSALLVFEVVRRIYKDEKFALLGEFVFIGTGFIWYVPLYNSGLYPNLFAIILSIAYLVELHNFMEVGQVRLLGTFAVVAFGLYLSHYFAPIFIGAVVVSVILASVMRTVAVRRVVLGIVLTLAPLVGLLKRPDLLSLASQVLGNTSTQGSFSYSTPLADVFYFIPFVRYSIAEIFNYASIVIIFGIPLALYYTWRHRRDSWLLLTLAIWIAFTWALAPNGELAWRFSFQALAPLLLLTPATFSLAPRFVRWVLGRERSTGKKRRGGRSGGYRFSDIATMAILVLLIVGDSWTSKMVGDFASDQGSYSSAQRDLYDSMVWFAKNTPPQSSLLSPTDWRIAFLEPITGRAGQLLLLAPGAESVAYAKLHNYDYVLVTYLIPSTLPPTIDLTEYYNSFDRNQSLTMVYQNGYDTIYQVK